MNRFCTALLGGCLAGALLAASSGCRRQAGSETDDGGLKPPPASQKFPDAELPVVVFPKEFETDDPAVNKFVGEALDCCRKGDYDQFRQLFGVASEPPGGTQFDKVWKSVKQITIASKVLAGPQQPPEYYVHVKVQLRQPDREERTERQAVLRVFKEEDNWRMARAPSEIQGQILYPATQAGDGGPAATRPSRRHGNGRSTAGSTQPAR